MHKIIMMIAAMVMFSSVTAQAQSFESFLRMLSGSSEQTKTDNEQDAVKAVKLSADKLRGTWTYAAPALKYEGDDMLATIALKGVESYLPSIFAKAGLTPGVGTLTFTRTRDIHASAGDRKVSGSYSYNAKTSALTLTAKYGDKRASIDGEAMLEGDYLVLLFDASEAANIVTTMSQEAAQNDTFALVKSILDKYPGIKLGCKLKK